MSNSVKTEFKTWKANYESHLHQLHRSKFFIYLSADKFYKMRPPLNYCIHTLPHYLSSITTYCTKKNYDKIQTLSPMKKSAKCWCWTSQSFTSWIVQYSVARNKTRGNTLYFFFYCVYKIKNEVLPFRE